MLALLPEFLMLGSSAADALAPHFEAGGFHRASHQLSYVIFAESELGENCLKWCSVFPCHFDNTAAVFKAESVKNISCNVVHADNRK